MNGARCRPVLFVGIGAHAGRGGIKGTSGRGNESVPPHARRLAGCPCALVPLRRGATLEAPLLRVLVDRGAAKCAGLAGRGTSVVGVPLLADGNGIRCWCSSRVARRVLELRLHLLELVRLDGPVDLGLRQPAASAAPCQQVASVRATRGSFSGPMTTRGHGTDEGDLVESEVDHAARGRQRRGRPARRLRRHQLLVLASTSTVFASAAAWWSPAAAATPAWRHRRLRCHPDAVLEALDGRTQVGADVLQLLWCRRP